MEERRNAYFKETIERLKDAVTKFSNNKIISNIKVWIKERWLFLLTIIIFLTLLITPIAEKIAFVSDYLKLSKVKPKDYFGLIIGVIASFFGILMAVIVLTVEVFKEKISKNRHTNPLENKLIRDSILHSVNLMGLSFIAYIFFETFNSAKSLTIGYFLGIIFIIYIYSAFFVIKKIVSKSSQIKANIETVKELDLNSFKSASRYFLYKPDENNKILKILKKEIDSYILSNNVSAYEKISDDILKKALNIISNGQDRNDCDYVIGGLVWLWRENCKTAIRVDDSNYFELVWNNIKEIYKHFANEKAPLLNLQDLDLFIELDFFKLHIRLNNPLPLSVALDCIEISFKANIDKNCPNQEVLLDLIHIYEGGEYEDSDFDSSTQWDGILGIFRKILKVQETAMKINDKDVFEESSRRIISICQELNFHTKSLGKYQKGIITWTNLTSLFSNSDLALKTGMYNSTIDCLYVPNHFIRRLIEEKSIDNKDVRIIIRSLADSIVLAFKNRKLFTDGHYGTLRDFSLIGFSSLKTYSTNKESKQIVNYIIKVLIHLKNLAEKDLSKIKPNDYLAIKGRIRHFINFAGNHLELEENKKPLKKWIKIENDFKDISEEINFGIVKWKVEKKNKNI